MKKLMIALAFAGMFTGVSAQTSEVPTEKYSVATNSFWSNWFISAGFDANSFYTATEDGGAKGVLNHNRLAYGYDAAIGKWFTPGLGLRVKGNAQWAKSPLTNDDNNKFYYFTVEGQALFNLSNMLCGYNESRVWNFIPYAGAGVAHRCGHNSANSLIGTVGILNTWRLCKRVNFNIDVNFSAVEDRWDGVEGVGENKVILPGHDKIWNASAGFTVNLGKTGFAKTPDVDAIMAQNQAQVDALQSSLSDAEAENARLKALLAKAEQNQPAAKTELASVGSSVFFNINSAKVASKKDLVNVQAIADYAKANNSKIEVKGYADSKTGSASYNQSLAQKRAETVANELVKMGVSRDNITIASEGGVNTLTPYSYNRRAVVTLK